MSDELPPKWQIGIQLFLLGRRWRRILDEELRRYGLTDATWRPLLHLGRLGDGLRQNELAGAMEIQGPSLVRLLDNLERDGLVERRGDAGDRRAKIILMTEAGRATYARVVTVMDQVAERLLFDADPADLAATQRLFDRLAVALQGTEPADEL